MGFTIFYKALLFLKKRTMKQTKIIIIFLIFLLIITLLLSSIKFIAFNKNFYLKEFNKNNTQERINNPNLFVDMVIGFFNNKNVLSNDFTAKEKLHMNDVKYLIRLNNIILNILIVADIILLSFLLYLSKNKIKSIANTLLFFGLTGILLSSVLFLSSFSKLFLMFHLIFFKKGTWIFDYNSTLIKLFPQSFFYNCLITIIFYCTVVFLVSFVLGVYLSKRSSN
jgi:integral membrane protein (TIGR01906 family)